MPQSNEVRRKQYAENPEIREKARENYKKWLAQNPDYHKNRYEDDKKREDYLQKKAEWRAANPHYHRKRREDPAEKEKDNARSLNWMRAKRERLAGRPKPKNCELCGNPSPKIVWDHNHETGKFRGWICTPCNYILGRVKDDPEVLRKMADYLDQHK